MLKSYNFWIRLVAVVVLLLRIVGAEFGFSVDSGLIIDLATAIASVLVVLGVIQVPVDKGATGSNSVTEEGENNNGGNFMKTFEQIKEDILSVKEKIATGLTGEESVIGEISVLLDGIIGENTEEVTEAQEGVDEAILITTEETLPTENIVEPITEEVITSDGLTEAEIASELNLNTETAHEVVANEVLLNEEVFEEIDAEQQAEALLTDEGFIGELVEDTSLGLQTVATSEIGEENAEVNIDTAKLNEIVRRKIYEVLEKDMEEIIAEIIV